MDALSRFMQYVVQDDATGCWNWQAYRNKLGYGAFGIGSRTDGSRRRIGAHRWSYEHFVGPIPEGLSIDHLCRNPSCVNPGHLEPVTNGENVRRGEGISVQNARKTACPQGHPYEGGNVYYRPEGDRVCRECHRQRVKAIWRAANPNHAIAPGERTHCPAGHPYRGANLRIAANGSRICRECNNARRRTGRPTGRPRQDVCQHGHPLSGTNLYVNPQGGRCCRECDRAARARRRARNR